jgi:hypothetical protein
MSQLYDHLKHIHEVPEKLPQEFGEFFVNYHKLKGDEYRTLGNRGPSEALRKIKQQRVAA